MHLHSNFFKSDQLQNNLEKSESQSEVGFSEFHWHGPMRNSVIIALSLSAQLPVSCGAESVASEGRHAGESSGLQTIETQPISLEIHHHYIQTSSFF